MISSSFFDDFGEMPVSLSDVQHEEALNVAFTWNFDDLHSASKEAEALDWDIGHANGGLPQAPPTDAPRPTDAAPLTAPLTASLSLIDVLEKVLEEEDKTRCPLLATVTLHVDDGDREVEIRSYKDETSSLLVAVPKPTITTSREELLSYTANILTNIEDVDKSNFRIRLKEVFRLSAATPYGQSAIFYIVNSGATICQNWPAGLVACLLLDLADLPPTLKELKKMHKRLMSCINGVLKGRGLTASGFDLTNPTKKLRGKIEDAVKAVVKSLKKSDSTLAEKALAEKIEEGFQERGWKLVGDAFTCLDEAGAKDVHERVKCFELLHWFLMEEIRQASCFFAYYSEGNLVEKLLEDIREHDTYVNLHPLINSKNTNQERVSGDNVTAEMIKKLAEKRNLQHAQNKKAYNLNKIWPGSVLSLSNKQRPTVKSIKIASDIKAIPKSFFRGCSSVSSINFNELKELKSIGGSAFRFCSALVKVDMSELTELTEIGSNAFEGCSALVEFTFPPSVTIIKKNTFYRCPKLVYVKLPSSLRKIEWGAFPKKNADLCFVAQDTIGEAALMTLSHRSSGTLVIMDVEENEKDTIHLKDVERRRKRGEVWVEDVGGGGGKKAEILVHRESRRRRKY